MYMCLSNQPISSANKLLDLGWHGTVGLHDRTSSASKKLKNKDVPLPIVVSESSNYIISSNFITELLADRMVIFKMEGFKILDK